MEKENRNECVACEVFSWKDDFLPKCCPDGAIWKHDANEDLVIDFGMSVAGKDDVEIIGYGGWRNTLIAGLSGSGKTVLLDSIIATMARKYSPEVLRFIMLDAKCGDFVKYSGKHGKHLPHIEACVCSMDTEAFKSTFKYVADEVKRRYRILQGAGVKTVAEYNRMIGKGLLDKTLSSKGVNLTTPKEVVSPIETEYLPRIVFFVNEFGILFDRANSQTHEYLNKMLIDIIKFGRATNINLVFDNQSVSCLDDDIKNSFDLRVALRSTAEQQANILWPIDMTNKLPVIKEPYGYLYARGVFSTAVRKYKVPFITGEDILNNINTLADRQYDCLPMVCYEDNVVNPIRTIFKEASHNIDKVKQYPGAVFFGEEIGVRSSCIPANVVLGKLNGSHIYSHFSDKVDAANFFKSVIMSSDLHDRDKWSLCVDCRDIDLLSTCNVRTSIDNGANLGLRLGFPNESEKVLDGIENLVNTPSKRYLAENHTFVLVGWDSIISENKEIEDRLSRLLRVSPVYGIHFIFISVEAKVSHNIADYCRYVLCGKTTEEVCLELLCKKVSFKPVGNSRFIYLSNQGDVHKYRMFGDPDELLLEPDQLVIPRTIIKR